MRGGCDNSTAVAVRSPKSRQADQQTTAIIGVGIVGFVLFAASQFLKESRSISGPRRRQAWDR